LELVIASFFHTIKNGMKGKSPSGGYHYRQSAM